MVRTRVLVAYEDEYRAYREVIAAGIRALRPRVAVATSTPAELEGEIRRFDPQVVVCGSPAPKDGGSGPVWVEGPSEPWRPATVRVGACRREPGHLSLAGLLEVVDEAEELVRAGGGGSRGPIDQEGADARPSRGGRRPQRREEPPASS